MSTVPPGNKQLGDLSNIVTYNMVDNCSYLKNSMINSFGLIAPTTPVTPSNIKNVMIGDISSVITYSQPDNTNFLKAYNVNAFGVVKYNIPTNFKSYMVNSFAVVSRPNSDTPSPTATKNISIGDLSNVITFKQSENTSYTKVSIIQAFVIVKEIKKRKETTTFNVSLHTEKLDFNTF